MRILVVDDEPAVRTALRRALLLEGYDVDLAADGFEALDAVTARAPDALVLDVLMPRLDGLDAGADDYLVKPFALDELLARLRALLRRAGADEDDEAVLRFSDLVLDPARYEVRRGTRAIELTRTEFSLLELFLRNPRQVLTREVIVDRVWGSDFGPTSNSLEVYVGYLRRKLEAGGEPRLIHTLRGVGYALREASQQ